MLGFGLGHQGKAVTYPIGQWEPLNFFFRLAKHFAKRLALRH